MTRAPLRLAVIGHPIAHSLSPRMHARALDALGVAGSYVALDVLEPELARTLGRLREGELDGLNVTIPYKTAVIALLDEISADARAAGAVNTVIREGARLVGENTDVAGLTQALAERGVTMRDRAVVVLGAGGAARAVISAARGEGARSVVLAARDRERAAVLAGRPSEMATALGDRVAVADALARADLVIQASSATMGPDADGFVKALPLDALRAGTVITDLVYRPRETALLRACAARGLTTIDGVGMLVHQGALSLARWLGRSVDEMPIEAMRDAVLEGL